MLRSATKEGQITYKGIPIRIAPDYAMETMKARRSWSDVVEKLKEHECQPRLLYLAKLSITISGVNRIFHEKTRFKQYLYTNLANIKL